MNLSVIAALLLSASAMTLPGSMARSASTSLSLAAASASLVGRRQCVPFAWVASSGSPRGAISVPVQLNGRMLRLQLDTGADATSVYGRLAAKARWAKAGKESFRAARFTLAGTSVDRPTIYMNAEMERDPLLQGTLGLRRWRARSP